MGAHDATFLEQFCQGWPAWRDALESLSWEEIVAKSGVARQEIDRLAEAYAASRSAVFSWTMGITHHAPGVENVQAIANLALLRGMAGRPGAGLLPIRGHSNVQGIGSMGVTPQLKEAVFARLQDRFGVRLPTVAGRDTMSCMEGASSGQLKVGFCLGGNLYGSNPDSAFARQALENLDLLVYMSTTLNTGHAHGLARETLILPVLARDEEPQPTTQESMFNFVRLSDGGPRRLEGPQSEVQVIATLAEQTLEALSRNPSPAEAVANLQQVAWRSMRDTGKIRAAVAAVVPGFEQLADIDRTKKEFQIEGRTFHQPRFATADGRARLHVHQLPELHGRGANELRLMTIRSEGQFNTVVYEDYDLYRNVDRRDVILIHPDDLTRLQLDARETVRVSGPAGSMSGIRLHPFAEIRPGNAAMYYPECNVLVGRQLDPASKTPAFKCVVVTLSAERLKVLAEGRPQR
jgi:molybdopterin-dependent oxidoreductase alpha subunit